jgi:hypothetical protein
MSVAGAWKVVSQFTGWSARADVPTKSVVAAPALARHLALARNVLIALIVSQFLAVAPTRITNNAGTGIPDSLKVVQTILFFPPQERTGRNRAAFLRASADGGSKAIAIQANRIG